MIAKKSTVFIIGRKIIAEPGSTYVSISRGTWYSYRNNWLSSSCLTIINVFLFYAYNILFGIDFGSVAIPCRLYSISLRKNYCYTMCCDAVDPLSSEHG